MSDQRILVVDDDPAILSALTRGLRLEGYRVVAAEDAEAALASAQAERPTAIVLDRMLPDQDGLETCKQLRALGDFPILMLTARDALMDRVTGLDAGADDYLVKPFALVELLARLRALLRRVPTASDDHLRFEDVTMDLAAHRVWRGDRPVELRPREYDLLEFFLRNPDRVLPRGLLFERVWGCDFLGDSNVIDVTVKNLRQRLDESGEPDVIHTVRRVGYALRSS